VDIRIQQDEFAPTHSEDLILELLKMREYGLFDDSVDSQLQDEDLSSFMDASDQALAANRVPSEEGESPRSRLNAKLEEHMHRNDDLMDMSDDEFLELYHYIFSDFLADEEEAKNISDSRDEVDHYEAMKRILEPEWHEMDKADALRELHQIALERLLTSESSSSAQSVEEASQKAFLQAKKWLSEGLEEKSHNGWRSREGPNRPGEREDLKMLLKDRKLRPVSGGWQNKGAAVAQTLLSRHKRKKQQDRKRQAESFFAEKKNSKQEAEKPTTSRGDQDPPKE